MQKAGSGRRRGFEDHGGFSGRTKLLVVKSVRLGIHKYPKCGQQNGYTAEAILES